MKHVNTRLKVHLVHNAMELRKKGQQKFLNPIKPHSGMEEPKNTKGLQK